VARAALLEVREAKKGRNRVCIADGGRYRCNPIGDLFFGSLAPKPPQVRMMLSVRSDRMTFGVNSLCKAWVGFGHGADHEERRLHTLRSQCIEHARGVRRYWSIVEGEHHLMIFKGQRLCEIVGAHMGIFERVHC